MTASYDSEPATISKHNNQKLLFYYYYFTVTLPAQYSSGGKAPALDAQ
jgi:hypothetical protein